MAVRDCLQTILKTMVVTTSYAPTPDSIYKEEDALCDQRGAEHCGESVVAARALPVPLHLSILAQDIGLGTLKQNAEL